MQHVTHIEIPVSIDPGQDVIEMQNDMQRAGVPAVVQLTGGKLLVSFNTAEFPKAAPVIAAWVEGGL